VGIEPRRVIFRRTAGLLLLLLLVVGATAASAAIEARDDEGSRLALAAPARRVVTLAPFLTELAFAAGAGSAVVGVAAFSDEPPQATRLPRVGDAARADRERIAALAPDLVLAWGSGNRRGDIEWLRARGVAVFVAEPRSLADVARLMRTIGRLAGSEAQAERGADVFEAELAGLRARYATGSAVAVVYEIWHRPLVVAGGRHLIGDAIRACGGANVYEAEAVLAPAVSLESVVARRPQLVAGGRESDRGGAAFTASWMQDLARLPGWRPRLAYIDPDLIQRQSPRVLAGVRQLCEAVDAVRGTPR
jgi:iron complex transport system substrate-binding protein